MKNFADKAKGINIMKKVQEAGDLTRAKTTKLRAVVGSALAGDYVEDEKDLKIKTYYRNYLKRPKSVRVEQEIHKPDGSVEKQVTVSDGEKIYFKTPGSDKVGSLAHPSSGYTDDDAFFAPGIGIPQARNLSEEDENYYWAGEETIEGVLCDVVESYDGTQRLEARLWIDRDHHRIMQTEIKTTNGKIRSLCSDYIKAGNGVAVPGKIRTYHDDVLFSCMKIEDIEFDCQMDDSIFTRESLE